MDLATVRSRGVDLATVRSPRVDLATVRSRGVDLATVRSPRVDLATVRSRGVDLSEFDRKDSEDSLWRKEYCGVEGSGRCDSPCLGRRTGRGPV